MPLINKLITRIETSRPGSSVRSVLKSGTEVEVIKGKSAGTVEIKRKTRNGSIITTLLKKVKDMYVPKMVKEEHRFGIININYRADGSRAVQIRVCDKKGRNAKANTGFYKTTLEENIFAKNTLIRSAKAEMKLPKAERVADIGFLLHLDDIRNNRRYKIPTENYSINQDMRYDETDLKKCKN